MTGVCELIDVEYFRNDLRPAIRFGTLQKGENILKVVFADEPDKEYDYYPSYPSFYPPQPEDIRLSRITLEEKIFP